MSWKNALKRNNLIFLFPATGNTQNWRGTRVALQPPALSSSTVKQQSSASVATSLWATSSPVAGRCDVPRLLRAGTWLGIYNNTPTYSPCVEEALTQLKLGQEASIGGKKIQQII